MVIIILMFTTFLIQAYSIPVGDNQDTSVTKGRYHFNHPPTVERYNPIEETLQYSEKVVNKPRIYKEVNQSEDILETQDNTSTEIIPDQLSIDNVQVIKKNQAKGHVIINAEENSDDLVQKESTKKSEIELKSIVKDNIRKSKHHKRVVRQLLRHNRDLETNSLNPILNSNLKEKRERDPVIPILESENQVYAHNGKFRYSYLGGDGTTAFEEGKLKVFDDKTAGEAVVGGFSYTDKDGNDFSLSYTADENGYRPTGHHLPTPPPIPPAIARALQYLATKTVVESTTKI